MRREDETMCDAYLRHRLDGMGSRESARAAGFAGGVPSPQALDIWRAIEDLPGGDAERAREYLSEKLEKKEAEVARLKRLHRAAVWLVEHHG